MLRRLPPSANSINQTQAAIRKLLNLPEFQPAPIVRRPEQRLAVTGKQRIDDQPEFIDQPGVDKARRSAGAAHEVNGLAGPLF